jgi:hypothetical protein
MLPAQSTSQNCHKEDGCSIQTGWRVPAGLVHEVHECCKREGLRPGAFVARALRCYLGHPTEAERVWGAKELEKRVRFPPEVFHGKWL